MIKMTMRGRTGIMPPPVLHRPREGLQSDGIHAHVWPYRELAIVFLTAPVLARAAGTDEFAMRDRLLEAVEHACG
jgi:hypothetical protein